MGMEEHNKSLTPSDPKYKRAEDLPLGEQSKYVNVEGGGFIRADAKKFEEGIHERAGVSIRREPTSRYENPEVVQKRIEELKNELIHLEGMFRDNDINVEKESRGIWAEGIGTGEKRSESYLDPVEQIKKSNERTGRLKTE